MCPRPRRHGVRSLTHDERVLYGPLRANIWPGWRGRQSVRLKRDLLNLPNVEAELQRCIRETRARTPAIAPLNFDVLLLLLPTRQRAEQPVHLQFRPYEMTHRMLGERPEHDTDRKYRPSARRTATAALQSGRLHWLLQTGCSHSGLNA